MLLREHVCNLFLHSLIPHKDTLDSLSSFISCIWPCAQQGIALTHMSSASISAICHVPHEQVASSQHISNLRQSCSWTHPEDKLGCAPSSQCQNCVPEFPADAEFGLFVSQPCLFKSSKGVC